MNRFILHIIIFLGAFFLIQMAFNNLLLKKYAVPYHQNKGFTTQYENYLSKKDQFNTVFMGSSRTYRLISPQILDQELTALDIQSYNMGAHATFIPEAFYLLEMFLDSQDQGTKVKYVFMELTGINNIKFVNWISPQSYYYLDTRILKLVWNTHSNNPDLRWIMACLYTYPYIQGYLLKQIVPLYLLKTQDELDYYSGESGDGYYPLDLDLEKNKTERLEERRNEFLKDTSVLQERKKKQLRRKEERISETYADYLNHLVYMAEQKNIKLYYIIPPKLKYYRSLVGLKDLIQDQRVIDMGNYDEYPHLNFAEYNFDDGHFNHRGAALYSSYLAHKIEERLKAEQNTVPGKIVE